MTIAIQFIRCLAFAVAQTAPGEKVPAPEWPDLSLVRVLPRHNQWCVVPPEDREILRRVLTAASSDRNGALRRGNADQRAIAVFIADQQGDIGALLSMSDLLDDAAPTLAYGAPTSGVGEYARLPQSVRDYLTAAYLEWFGVDVNGSRKRGDEYFRSIKDPSRLVQPWIVRLRRAGDDAPALARIKAQIDALPEDVRWAVLSLGYSISAYDAREAAARLAKISEPLRQAIRARDKLLPDEPLFRMNEGAMRVVVLDECNRLLDQGL